EVRGPVLSELIYDFKQAWAHAGPWGDLGLAFAKKFKRRPNIEGDGVPVRLLYTKVGNPELYRAQLEAIRRAGKYIWINNAYFSDNTLINELIRARERGVDVRVVLPSSVNHGIMNKNNAVTANLMFKNGIRVYFYPGMSHIKAAVYDGWLCAGSANFDKLSLRDNLELNLATSDPETVSRFEQELFHRDFEASLLMTEPIESDISDFVANIVAQRL
ncbi:MAG TPA: phospholipase D-like domain-containing protein, partial [Candidatus Omnitrophota bacterium]|nr:phospholipase D-like domain-containing protein [Candidatus Omnitrophota bacterium]